MKLGIERPAKRSREGVSLTLRHDDGFDAPVDEDSPLAITSLGIAYRVLNRVRRWSRAARRRRPASAAAT